jgi:transposase
VDETTVQALNEPGRKNTSKSYMWVFRGVSRDHQIVMFSYASSRSTKAALPYLENYNGIIKTDGYAVYDIVSRENGIIHVGCMAHARRNFVDCMRIGRGPAAQSVIDLIGRLYAIEAEIRQKNLDDEIVLVRKKKVGSDT